MGNLIFRDSKTTRTKTLIMPTPEDDIVLTLPDESGILATTNTLGQKLITKESAGLISNILKPNINENNGGIKTPDAHNDLLLRASYKTTSTFKGKLEYTEWIAASDFAFKNIVDRTILLEHKDKWLPNVSTPSTKVFVKYRFHSQQLRSPWSDALVYTTPGYGVEPFTIAITAGTMSPAIIASRFRTFGENLIGPINHTATSWKIYENNKVIYQSLANTTDRLKHIVPYGILKSDTEYKVEVFFHTDNRTFSTSRSVFKMFTTPNIYIATPYVKYKYNGGNHTLEGSEYTIVGSSESHVSTYWELYRIENGTKKLIYKKEKDTNNLTILSITSMLFGRGLSYEVTMGYNSENISSKRATITFKPVDDLSDPITLRVEEDTDKLPILKISKFHVLGHTDNIKHFALRIRNTGTNKDVVEKLITVPNTYNQDIVKKLTPDEYISWFGARTDILNALPYFEISGYYVGEKFNSPMGKDNLLPTIELRSSFNIDARDHTYVKITPTTNTGIATWLHPTKKIFTLSKGHLVDPIEIVTTDSSITLGTAQNLQYGKLYRIAVKVETEIGTINAGETNFQLYQGKITEPTVSAKWDIEGVSQPRLHVAGNAYVYDKPEIPGSGHKEVVIRVLKGDEVILETTDTRNAGTWVALPKSKFPKLDWNTTYTIEMEYVADNGVRSPKGKLEYSLPVKPAVAVGIPVVETILGDNKLTLTASGWSITGVEDKSHKATDWYLYENNIMIWSDLNNTEKLTSIDVPSAVLEYGHTYEARVAFIGMDNIKSDLGIKTVTMLSSLVLNFIKNIETNRNFYAPAVWFDENMFTMMNFETGKFIVADQWGVHNGQYTTAIDLIFLGKQVTINKQCSPGNSAGYPGSVNNSFSIEIPEFKLTKQDIAYLLENFDLTYYNNVNNRGIDGYYAAHKLSVEEPWIITGSTDHSSGADTRRIVVPAHLKNKPKKKEWREWTYELYAVNGRINEDLVFEYNFNLNATTCQPPAGYTDGFKLIKLTWHDQWANIPEYVFPENTTQYNLVGSGRRTGGNTHYMNFGVPGREGPNYANTSRDGRKSIKLTCGGYVLV